MNELKCIIVDDNEIDRLTTLSYVKKFSIFKLLGIFENAPDAIKFIQNNPIDVIFLDIDMPEMNGFETRKKLHQVPVCIFITSHPEHAIESFEVETLDFIVKPLHENRFKKCVTRIEEFMKIKTQASLYEMNISNEMIFIKEGHEQIKVQLKDILYLEALKDYTLIVTTQKRHCVLSSIGSLLKENHFNKFIRIHRSFAIQKDFVSKISSQEIILNNTISIPIGRSFKDNLNLII